MKRQAFLFFALIFSTLLFGQDKEVDRLNETALTLYKADPQQAYTLLEEALVLAEKNKDKEQIAYTQNNLGIVLRDLGQYETAKEHSQKALEGTTLSTTKASAHNNLGTVNRRLGLYKEALENYLEAVKIYHENDMEDERATVHNNIGMVYSVLEMDGKAIEYHTKALEYFESQSNQKGIAEAINNIAIVYASQGEFEEALDFFKRALVIEEALDDKKGMAESLNNVGGAYYYLGSTDSAVYYFKLSAAAEKSIGNYAGVSASYNNIAHLLMEDQELSESKIFIDSAYYYARQSKTAEDIEMALLNYSDYYNEANDLPRALEYHRKYTRFRDSIRNLSNLQTLQELEVKYRTEKKEKEILEHRALLAENDLKMRRKNTLLYGTVGLTFVIGLLGYLLYNQQKLKNKQLKQESELQTALAKIETQNKLQEQRLRISRDLHDNIGAQLTFIISSIDNLKFGFTDISDKLSERLAGISGFTQKTIYELRDTIWAMNKEHIDVDDLQARIANFIKQAGLSIETTEFLFKVDDSVDREYVFSSQIGMNVYRIIQEGVNNAMKYALASKIEVQISQKVNQFYIDIVDNGVGFDIHSATHGNGLNNMKKRARDIGGSLVISSEKGKGTSVTLTFDA